MEAIVDWMHVAKMTGAATAMISVVIVGRVVFDVLASMFVSRKG